MHVLVSAVKEEAPDALLDGTDNNENASSGTAPAVTTPTIIEYEPVDTSKDQILTILDAHDGRMYQQDVIVETGFSAGTVSRLLSEMEDDGQIARLRKGREKIVVDPELLPPLLTEKR